MPDKQKMTDAMKINRIEFKEGEYPNMSLLLKDENGKVLLDIKELHNGIFVFDDPAQKYITERQVSFGELKDIIRIADNVMGRIKRNIEFMAEQDKKGKSVDEMKEAYVKRNEELKEKWDKKRAKILKEKMKEFGDLPSGFMFLAIRKDMDIKVMSVLLELVNRLRELGFLIELSHDDNMNIKSDNVGD